MKCKHCENEVAYELDGVGGETIFVCAEHDEDYTACEVCGKQGIWDDGYGNMSKAKESDDWPTCFECQKQTLDSDTLKMEVLIYPPLLSGGFDDEPMECVVVGKNNATSLDELKKEVNEVVLSTLKHNDYGSNTYFVKTFFKKGNRLVGGGGAARYYCDLTQQWSNGELKIMSKV